MDIIVPMENIVYRLLEHRKNIPDRTAIIYRDRPANYRTLYEDTIRTAEWLRDEGLGKDDRILVFVPLSYDLYTLLLAIFYIGATAVFVDAWADRRRMAQAIEITEPKGFVGSVKAQLLRILSPPIRKVPLKLTMWNNPFRTKKPVSQEDFDPVTISGEDTALVTFTTGSTGTPKAAKRTHRFLWTQHLVLSSELNLKEEDIDLTTLPVFVLNNLALGITSVIPDFNPAKPADINPPTIVKQIKRWKITTSGGSAAFYERLANYCVKVKDYPGFRAIFTGGSPVYPSIARTLLRAFPDTKVNVLYGSTEAEPISGIDAREVAESDVGQGLVVGKKVEEIEVAILKPHDGPVEIAPGKTVHDFCLPRGNIGEIIVTGDHVLKEYVNSPESFRQNKIVDGDTIWHRTGDAGVVDEDGEIRLFGRVKDRITYGGNVIYTFPVEQKLLELADVTCAAILERDGEIHMVVETAAADRSRLETSVRQLDLPFKNPKITFMNIPRDPRHNSKVDYGKLRLLLD